MGWDLLSRQLKSDRFRRDPSIAVDYLFRYANHVGIHYAVCLRLRMFSYSQIEVYLPQLCHLMIAVPNESVALEDFMLDLCRSSVTAALTTFWLVQAYLTDFSSNPNSAAFRTCQRIYNKIQAVVFAGNDAVSEPDEQPVTNVAATLVLAGLQLGGAFVPSLMAQYGPLAIGQARKPPTAELMGGQGEYPHSRLIRSQSGFDPTLSSSSVPEPREILRARSFTAASPRSGSSSLPPPGPDGESGAAKSRPGSRNTAETTKRPTTGSVGTPALGPTIGTVTTPSPASTESPPFPFDFSPDPRPASRPASSAARLTTKEKGRLLRSNYFQSQTQFLHALEQISVKLVAVPKPARLSALRAELAVINNELPADVDVPLISPPTLENGDPGRSRHHRIVRISPAEATSLNSAERVPFLLMIEVLRHDLDFDPRQAGNKQLIADLMSARRGRRRLFDLSRADGPTVAPPEDYSQPIDSLFEPGSGDLADQTLRPDDQTARSSDTSSRATSPFPSSSVGPKNRPTAEYDVGALATHMRAAAQMLLQLETNAARRPKHEVDAIRAKIIGSMQKLEEQSFSSADSARVRGADRMENDAKTGCVTADRDDPSYAAVGEAWAAKRDRIRRLSPFGADPGWDLVSVIVKTGADLRQEAFASQLIGECGRIWRDCGVDVRVHPIRILVTGDNSGLVETITNGVSLHSIKRSLTLSRTRTTSASGPLSTGPADGDGPSSLSSTTTGTATSTGSTHTRRRFASLKDHFDLAFGPEASPNHRAAVGCFARSLAGYSIISYLFQLKDRHNGNILLDSSGHIVHIDFGFLLSNSPGSMGFEAAPFKLTAEYVDVLGGVGSPDFSLFRNLCVDAFLALRQKASRLLMLIELMGQNSTMPCFGSGIATVLLGLRTRLVKGMSDEEVGVHVDELIGKSNGSYYTRMYDAFQYRTQGIY